MAQTFSETVTCPQCGQRQKITCYSSANVTLQPELKEEILANRLNHLCCRNCGARTPIGVPLLYHDMDQAIAVWLLPNGEAPPGQQQALDSFIRTVGSKHRCRLVHSANELLETVRIFDAGLNDFVIEMIRQSYFSEEKSGEEGPFFFVDVISESGQKLMAFESAATGRVGTVPLKNEILDMCRSADRQTRGQWLRSDVETSASIFTSAMRER